MIEKITNWFIKQKFLFDFVVLKKQNFETYAIAYPESFEPEDYTFRSKSFTDGQWNEYFEWDVEKKDYQNWNTYKYLRFQSSVKGFAQQYGEFSFLCKLDGEIGIQFPAIWLLDIKDPDTVSLGHYLEIDIELDAVHFWFTIQINNRNKKYEECLAWRSNFYNPWLWYLLRNEPHLYTIDWREDRIKFYIDGLLAARFKNVPHYPLAIILTKLTMNQVIVER